MYYLVAIDAEPEEDGAPSVEEHHVVLNEVLLAEVHDRFRCKARFISDGIHASFIYTARLFILPLLLGNKNHIIDDWFV